MIDGVCVCLRWYLKDWDVILLYNWLETDEKNRIEKEWIIMIISSE